MVTDIDSFRSRPLMVQRFKPTPRVEKAVERLLLFIQNNPYQNYSYYKQIMRDTYPIGTKTVQTALGYIEQEGLANVEFQKNYKIFSPIIKEHSYDKDVKKIQVVWNKELKKLEKEIKNLSNILKTKNFVTKISAITKINDKIIQYSFNAFQLHFLTGNMEDLERFSNLYKDFNHIVIQDKEGMMILFSITKLH